MLSATCPECGKTMEVTNDTSAHPVCCPLCGHEFMAPDVPELVPAVESTEEATTASDSAARPTRPQGRLPKIRDHGRKRRRPRQEKRSAWLTVVLVTGGIILACGGMGAGVYFLFVHEIDVPVAASDRTMVITAQRVAEFSPTLSIDPARDTFHKVRMLDGSRELTYEYDSTDGEGSVLYISHHITVEQTVSGARDGYVGQRIGAKYFARQIQQVERNDLWKWGDTSKCDLLMTNDKKVGNIFMGRKGRRYFFLIIVGVYFEDPGPIRELLDPVLQRLDTYEG
jgi:hypothetical protein